MTAGMKAWEPQVRAQQNEIYWWEDECSVKHIDYYTFKCRRQGAETRTEKLKIKWWGCEQWLGGAGIKRTRWRLAQEQIVSVECSPNPYIRVICDPLIFWSSCFVLFRHSLADLHLPVPYRKSHPIVMPYLIFVIRPIVETQSDSPTLFQLSEHNDSNNRLVISRFLR